MDNTKRMDNGECKFFFQTPEFKEKLRKQEEKLRKQEFILNILRYLNLLTNITNARSSYVDTYNGKLSLKALISFLKIPLPINAAIFIATRDEYCSFFKYSHADVCTYYTGVYLKSIFALSCLTPQLVFRSGISSHEIVIKCKNETVLCISYPIEYNNPPYREKNKYRIVLVELTYGNQYRNFRWLFNIEKDEEFKYFLNLLIFCNTCNIGDLMSLIQNSITKK